MRFFYFILLLLPTKVGMTMIFLRSCLPLLDRRSALLTLCVAPLLVESRYPDHFFCLDSKAKKHEACLSRRNLHSRWRRIKASLHGTQCRFIRRSRASCTAGALHIFAFSDEAAPFPSAMKHCSAPLHNMKHSLRSYDEKMKNVSLSVCNTIVSALYYYEKNFSSNSGKTER